jgi:endoglycosylceramidase
MITTRNSRFYDPEGRQVILHGINYVNKDPQAGYLFPDDDGATFADFRRWGFNCLRLGVIWDGLEPQPGVYNEAYLQGIQRQLDWAHEHGLYVFIDMHQDLYSVLYSDGAPAWATLHEGQPHVSGEVWSDAYFASPAVQTALDNFWRNAPASDGIGLQDHFAACWKLLAARFGAHPAVIGYDLLNEPMTGSTAPQALGLQFARGAELLMQSGVELPVAEGADPMAAMLALWSDPEGRFQILQALNDPQAYAEVMEAPRPVYNQFEQEALMPFFRRVAAAIRAVDTNGILFLETSMGSNMGVYSAIEPLEGETQQAYAPHGYDLVVDTPNVAHASNARVEVIFSHHGETARKHGWPMLVGEWGAYGFWPETLPAARGVVRLFEQLLCSDTYWAYQPDLEQAACFPALSRPYPERVAGVLKNYHFDPATGGFACAWQEDPAVTAPTVIYLPAWLDFDPANLTLTPSGEYRLEKSASGDVWLHIRPTGTSTLRNLTTS